MWENITSDHGAVYFSFLPSATIFIVVEWIVCFQSARFVHKQTNLEFFLGNSRGKRVIRTCRWNFNNGNYDCEIEKQNNGDNAVSWRFRAVSGQKWLCSAVLQSFYKCDDSWHANVIMKYLGPVVQLCLQYHVLHFKVLIENKHYTLTS